jgi:phage repressor protein C with HTH and peptisase S24 domain
VGRELIDEQLHSRIDYAIQRLGGSVKAALVTGIPKSTLNRWTQDGGPDIPSQGIRALAENAKISVSWLVTGRGSPDAKAGGFEAVPLYDVRLAAGVAKFSEAARVNAMIPIDASLLLSLGRQSADGLGFVEAAGDSMFPTIPDGSRVLLDLNDTYLREGIFGFRHDNDLRVKRLLKRADGIDIISDNEHYPSERLEGDALNHFQVIGRAKLVVSHL